MAEKSLTQGERMRTARQHDRDDMLTHSIAELVQVLARKEEHLAQARQELWRLSDVDSEIVRLRGMLSKTTAQLSALSRENKFLKDEMRALRSSTSWRLMAPARFLIKKAAKPGYLVKSFVRKARSLMFICLRKLIHTAYAVGPLRRTIQRMLGRYPRIRFRLKQIIIGRPRVRASSGEGSYSEIAGSDALPPEVVGLFERLKNQSQDNAKSSLTKSQ
jgi:cell division protein FtsB